MPKRKHARPVYLQTTPHYVIQLPWVSTSGSPRSPYEWVNGAHAAIHSLVSALKQTDLVNARDQMAVAHWQITKAKKAVCKLDAKVLPA